MVKKSGIAYVSKGQRPNVSRKLTNAMRRERRANPTQQMIIARLDFRNEVAKRQDRASKESFQRILAREAVYEQASALYEKYKSAYVLVKNKENGATDRRSYCAWSACVQAAKTDYVSMFHGKWGPRLGQSNEDKKSEKR